MIAKQNNDVMHCKGLLDNKGSFWTVVPTSQSLTNTRIECTVNFQKPRLLSSPEIPGLSKTGLIFKGRNGKICSAEMDT